MDKKKQQLNEALASGNYNECRNLLNTKLDIENFQMNRIYPLCLACEYNKYELVELFINVY
jgi:hypothetical protein